ncbi:hypothetical protein H5410_001456, partial [Solanum commersonii]
MKHHQFLLSFIFFVFDFVVCISVFFIHHQFSQPFATSSRQSDYGKSSPAAEQHHDEEVRPYIQQLMKTQSCYPVQTSEDNNSIDTVVELNNEP